MAMPALVADWTIDRLDALPDDGQRYELIDGVLHVPPSPNEGHQDVALALSHSCSICRRSSKTHSDRRRLYSFAEMLA
jgi:hypothetical protein